MNDYSTKKASQKLLEEITNALKNIRGWGSVEIIVQDFRVVQITERNIKKTSERTRHAANGIKDASPKFSSVNIATATK